MRGEVVVVSGRGRTLAAGRHARAGLKKVGPRQYRTSDGRFHIERDVDSIGEYDEIGDLMWYVYDSATVDRGVAGPPDALIETRTLAAAVDWVERNQSAI